MKNIFLCLVFFCVVVQAETLPVKYRMAPVTTAVLEEKVSYVFPTIKLNELARLNYSEVQKENFIFDPDFLTDNQQVSVELKNISTKTLDHTVSSLLAGVGVCVAGS